MSNIRERLFKKVKFSINEESAYNIRQNGELYKRNNTKNIIIKTKTDKPGIDIIIKKNAKGEVFIPVIVGVGMHDKVYNEYLVEEGADVTIYAACLLHNDEDIEQGHEGIHTFNLAKDSKVKYIEKHYGEGHTGNNEMNTTTEINLEDNSYLEIDMIQIGGLNKSIRKTKAKIMDNATLLINEKLKTNNNDTSYSDYQIELNGQNSSATINSKSVATEFSKQDFITNLIGNNASFGHIECDAIIINNAEVTSIPQITAKDSDANLTHEAAIGKIAEDEILKLMTLGLNEEEANEKIIEGFMK